MGDRPTGSSIYGHYIENEEQSAWEETQTFSDYHVLIRRRAPQGLAHVAQNVYEIRIGLPERRYRSGKDNDLRAIRGASFVNSN
jgi:hypothetical protein